MRTLPLSTAPLAVNVLLYPARKITLYGRNAASLSYHYAAESACERNVVTFICGDNRFDPYAIARFAKLKNQSREMTLSRILIARAFTGFQFVELVRRLEPDKIFGPVIVSGICSAFLDEDIADNDAARLYYRTLSRLGELADKGVAFLLIETEEIGKTRRAYFLKDLFRASNFVFRFEGDGSYTLEMRRHRPISYLASTGKALLP